MCVRAKLCLVIMCMAWPATGRLTASLINNEGFVQPVVGSQSPSDHVSKPTGDYWVYSASNSASDAGIIHSNSSFLQSPPTTPLNQQGQQAPPQMGYLLNSAEILQQFDVPATGLYLLTYSIAGPQSTSGNPHFAGQSVTTSLDGSTLSTFTPTSDNWTSFQTPLNLTAGDHAIAFQTFGSFFTGPYVAFVDEVYLTPYHGDVPEPASIALIGVGGASLLIRRRR